MLFHYIKIKLREEKSWRWCRAQKLSIIHLEGVIHLFAGAVRSICGGLHSAPRNELPSFILRHCSLPCKSPPPLLFLHLHVYMWPILLSYGTRLWSQNCLIIAITILVMCSIAALISSKANIITHTSRFCVHSSSSGLLCLDGLLICIEMLILIIVFYTYCLSVASNYFDIDDFIIIKFQEKNFNLQFWYLIM